MPAVYWPNAERCSLAKWHQLLIGQVMSAIHWPTSTALLPTYVSCLSANWCQLLISQLTSAAYQHWRICFDTSGIRTLLVDEDDIKRDNTAAHWPSDVSCSLVSWCQLLIGQLMSAAHLPVDISCSLATWCQLLICQLTSRISDLRICFSDLVDFLSCF